MLLYGVNKEQFTKLKNSFLQLALHTHTHKYFCLKILLGKMIEIIPV